MLKNWILFPLLPVDVAFLKLNPFFYLVVKSIVFGSPFENGFNNMF